MEEKIQESVKVGKNRNKKNIINQLKKSWQLYIFVAPAVVYFIIFEYAPMYGLQIAFKDFKATEGILGSQWVGFKHFVDFFNAYNFWTLIKNTFLINLYELIFAFPAPIILALSLNQLARERYKKFLQTITYAPHFISTVVMAGMLYLFLLPSSGFINNIIDFFWGETINFLVEIRRESWRGRD